MRGDGREWFGLFVDPQQLRSRWLSDMSQAMDSYLRSPAFLEWLQYTLRAMNEAQSLQVKGFTNLLYSSEDRSSAESSTPR